MLISTSLLLQDLTGGAAVKLEVRYDVDSRVVPRQPPRNAALATTYRDHGSFYSMAQALRFPVALTPALPRSAC